jgi:putative flippase GtrA
MMMRWLKFNLVSAGGILVQTAALVVLVRVARAHYLVATALAVEAAVLHNFFWHKRWTWADRPGMARAGAARLLARFNLTTGLFSIAGNLLLMRLLAGSAGLDPFLANLITIALCSLINFLLSDRLVFIAKESADSSWQALTGGKARW